MKSSRVQEALKILRSSAEDIYLEGKPKARKSAKARVKKAAAPKSR